MLQQVVEWKTCRGFDFECATVLRWACDLHKHRTSHIARHVIHTQRILRRKWCEKISQWNASVTIHKHLCLHTLGAKLSGAVAAASHTHHSFSSLSCQNWISFKFRTFCKFNDKMMLCVHIQALSTVLYFFQLYSSIIFFKSHAD